MCDIKDDKNVWPGPGWLAEYELLPRRAIEGIRDALTPLIVPEDLRETDDPWTRNRKPGWLEVLYRVLTRLREHR